MKFHSQHCSICNSKQIFLEKLTKPSDPDCVDVEDVCQNCGNPFKVKEVKSLITTLRRRNIHSAFFANNQSGINEKI